VWRFHKYYIRELFVNLGLTFVMLFGVALIALIARGISRAQGTGLLTAFQITLLWTFDIIPHLLPISLLVATVFTFGRASGDNEIIALRGTGQSPLRLMGAVLFVGAVVSSLNTWLLHDLIPYVHFRKFHISTSLISQFFLNNRPSQNRYSFQHRFLMVWERKEGNTYYEVTFEMRARGSALSYDGFAREVRFSSDRTGRFLHVDLIDVEGVRIDHSKGLSVANRLDTSLAITIDLRDMAHERHEGIKDTGSAQLLTEISRGVCPRPEEASWFISWRSCHAFAALLFAIVGFPIGVLARAGGRMVAFAFSFIPLSVYYVLNFFGPILARETGRSWPALIPIGGVLLLAVFLIHRAFRR